MSGTRKVLLVLGAVIALGISLAGPADAATLEVGSGKTYGTIQTAVDTADPNDQIVVYEGTYEEWVVVDAEDVEEYLTIKANTGDKVVVVGGFTLSGISTNICQGNLIEGFYVVPVGSTACYSYYASHNTWRNMVVYGNSGQAAFGGYLMYGSDLVDHCTIYDCGWAGSYGYGSAANVSDTIVASNQSGWFNAGENAPAGPPYTGYYSYTCWYNNPGSYYGQEDPYTAPLGDDETGNVYANPRFASVDPNNPYFLYLQLDTSPCVGTASDSTNIGALGSTTYIDPDLPAELHVGSGQPYATIQAAVDDAEQGDTIVVHDGSYDGVSVNAANGKEDLTIYADLADRVVVYGGFNLVGTSDNLCQDNFIEGFYCTQKTSVINYSYYANNNTWRHIVVFGDRTQVAFGGELMYGYDTIDHCTVYNCSQLASYGWASGAVIMNSILANCAGGWVPYTLPSYYGYTNWYDNPAPNAGWEDPNVMERSGYEGTSLNVDPCFISTDMLHPYFLYLEPNTPCVNAASGGTNMGALPVGDPDVEPNWVNEDPLGPSDPAWSYEYLGQNWPSTSEPPPTAVPKWNRDPISGNAYASLGVDFQAHERYFHLLSDTWAYRNYWWTSLDGGGENGTRRWRVDFDVGATVEVRARVHGLATGAALASGNDSNKSARLSIAGDPEDLGSGSVSLSGPIGSTVTYDLDTTQWHIYRIVWEGNWAALYVDGSEVPALMVPMEVGTFNNRLTWGDTSGQASAYVDYDYIRLYNDGPVPAVPGELLSGDPTNGESLGRLSKNQITVVSSRTIDPNALPAVPLSIVKMGTATDAGGNFTYSLGSTHQSNDTLIATEIGTALDNNAWYSIKPVGYWMGRFFVNLPAVQGDVDADQDVDLADYALLAAAWPDSGPNPSLGRVDLDGDDDLDNTDLGILVDAWMAQAPANPLAAQSFKKWARDLYGPTMPLIGGDPNPETSGRPDPQPLDSDAGNRFYCSVRRKDASSGYMMWYTGMEWDGTGNPVVGTAKIHLAVSSGPEDPNHFTKYIYGPVQGMVMDQGDPNDPNDPDDYFDAHGCGRPCVIWDPNVDPNGCWKMWYSAVNGNRDETQSRQSIGYATSINGVHWNKHAKFGSGHRGEVFKANPTPGQFDSVGVLSPCVIYDDDDDMYKMWYRGTNDLDDPNDTGDSSGYAESADGQDWIRVAEIGDYMSPEVIKINDLYHMWYNMGSHIGYAVSFNGTDWSEEPDNPVLTTTNDAWDHTHIQEASVVYDSDVDKLYLYYSAYYWIQDNRERIGGAETSFLPY